MPAFQHGELLAEGKILQRQASASVKHAKEGSETEPKELEHGGKVIADRIFLCTPMSLISKPDGIVANDSNHARTLGDTPRRKYPSDDPALCFGCRDEK